MLRCFELKGAACNASQILACAEHKGFTKEIFGHPYLYFFMEFQVKFILKAAFVAQTKRKVVPFDGDNWIFAKNYPEKNYHLRYL